MSVSRRARFLDSCPSMRASISDSEIVMASSLVLQQILPFRSYRIPLVRRLRTGFRTDTSQLVYAFLFGNFACCLSTLDFGGVHRSAGLNTSARCLLFF